MDYSNLITSEVGGRFLTISQFPFFVGVVDSNSQPLVPTSLPFSLYIDKKLIIPRLTLTKNILESLEQAYSLGSMLSTPLGDSVLAGERLTEVSDTLANIFRVAGKQSNFISFAREEIENRLSDYLVSEPLWREAEIRVSKNNLFNLFDKKPTNLEIWFEKVSQGTANNLCVESLRSREIEMIKEATGD